MRIGELAAAAGVSTRTVRHYHQLGLMPEPPRTPGGYREYAVRDLVRLSHARRLVDLGLGLHEVRKVLADEEGSTLVEIIEVMEGELASQQERLDAQRQRLAQLRERVRGGRLGLEELPEAELVDFFTHIEAAGATGPVARLDRDVLAFVSDEAARRWIAPMLPLMGDEAYTRRLVAVYDGLDDLAHVAPDDPAVAALVERIIDLLPEESWRELGPSSLDVVGGSVVMEAVLDELTPGQAAAARLLMARVHGSAAGEPEPDDQPHPHHPPQETP